MLVAPRTIPLTTRDGTPIPNSIDAQPSPGQVALARRSATLLFHSVRELRPPTGSYNCHGLVFASRRTNIPPPGHHDPTLLDRILAADRYVQVSAPQVGDVVAYREPSGEIEHTGFVSKVEFIGAVPAIMVWSAWGSLGEFEHRVNVSPYTGRVEYWRIQP